MQPRRNQGTCVRMGDLFSKLFSLRPDVLRIRPEISRGAYGVVFQGRLGARPVAIKKIHGMLVEYARDTRGELANVLVVWLARPSHLTARGAKGKGRSSGSND